MRGAVAGINRWCTDEIDGRGPSGVAFAFCYGYIQGLLDAPAPTLRQRQA